MQPTNVPAEFICPLSGVMMTDPMMSRDGQNFERQAILNWLAEGNESCPVTKAPLRPSNLISNKALLKKIYKWKFMNGQAAEEPSDDADVLAKNFVGLVLVPPTEFVCPITKDVMEDPVMTRDGRSFERSAILEYIDAYGYCPLTKKTLLPSDLVSNMWLQKKIFDWKVQNAPAIAANTYFVNTPRRNNCKAVAA